MTSAITSSTSWNTEEDHRLQQLPIEAQIMYLRGIRRFMDYKNGIAGKAKAISWKSLSELCVPSVRFLGSNTLHHDPTRQKVRSAIEQMERVGLVEKLDQSARYVGLIFRCIWAKTDESAQIMNNPRTTTSPKRVEKPLITQQTSGIEAVEQPDLSTGKTTPTTTRTTSNPLSEILDSTHSPVLAFLRKNGINTPPQHQGLMMIEKMKDWKQVVNTAIGRARTYKPKGTIPFNYLDRVIQSICQEQKPKKARNLTLPYNDHDLEKWALKLGLPNPSMGESYATYRSRLKRCLEQQRHEVDKEAMPCRH